MRLKSVQFVLGLCLLLLPATAYPQACADLQAAITKVSALRNDMQREAAPFTSMVQMPVHHDGVCNAAQKLRDQVVSLAKMLDTKCLNDQQYKSVATIVDSNMREANSNIGLFCN